MYAPDPPKKANCIIDITNKAGEEFDIFVKETLEAIEKKLDAPSILHTKSYLHINCFLKGIPNEN